MKNSSERTTKMGTRRGQFNIMQYLYHPTEKDENGNPKQLWSVEDVERGLAATRQIEKWAWCLHDKDKWLQSDEIANPDHKAGELKPAHIHLVLKMKRGRYVEVDSICDWFNVPMNFIEFPRGGQRAFLDCVEYLTHEREEQQAKGKHRYTDDEVHANFDWRTELTEMQEKRIKTGRDLTPKEYLRLQVYEGKLTLGQAYEADPVAYVSDDAALKRLRLKYINERMEMPKYRENYYIQGKGGVGKDALSRALARQLVARERTPEEMQKMGDDEIFFVVGDKKTTFEGYDGQPVIIWSDCRGREMLARFNYDRGQLFKTLDKIPKKAQQNIKYSSLTPKNTYNIVNSVQSWREWVNEVCGAYTDREGARHEAEDLVQGLRRLDGWICLHEEDYDFGFNEGIYDGTFNFASFYVMREVRGSFGEIAKSAGYDYEIRDYLDGEVLQPWLEKHDESEGTVKKFAEKTDEEIEKYRAELKERFKDYGTVKNREFERIEPEEFEKARQDIEDYKKMKEEGIIKNAEQLFPTDDEMPYYKDVLERAEEIRKRKEQEEDDLPY